MTLELDSCTYAYRRWQAPILKDFDYQLPAGLTILLGPNGAGKSTLLRLAAGVTRPSKGSVRLDGVPSLTKTYRSAVAWMPQTITPMPSLTAREYVAYVGWLKGMSRADAWREARRSLARVELAGEAQTRTSRLSGGQLRRVGVAASLVHGARILLLDEPTAGMDPHQRRVFRDLLNTLTPDIRVLMSTHDVADLAEDADHVTVLNKGSILHTGTTDTFFSHTPPGTVAGRAAEGAYSALLGSTR
ncbi:ATP-binding cassette domain-containing protein [Streptomyces sp. NEAU-Y11]|uniref:ATP-binding cassette domain-containing protein n=1 Tax=Streptomyces cucumeris TaxID=2962890 RepID=UPI0020C88223|nr:ATP-binding cassette domain-containing protein [Streptomyces sp. NEAU-Y11]MCP9210967.1 ATP-binding cassette domain-containing protein [Streptomyces sp. NEAU-Y11]